MRSDHRRFADGQHVVKSFVRHVRDVHHHPQAIHFAHHLLAEIGQPVVRGLVRGSIRPIRVHRMSQRHVTHAQREELVQVRERVVDHVPALDAHQHGDFTSGLRAANFLGGGAQHQVIRVPQHSFAHRCNLIERALHRRRPGDRPRNPYREKNRAEPAFAHARDVHAAVRVPHTEIEFRIQQPLRGVVVRIHHNGLRMQFARRRRNGRLRL